ncbi:hypothetical protein D9619_002308 [Psilocybe cf. subviscida]|uniref:Amidohydrolase 3 domain-containing protein n=1 Tax=Psilocybe cf. subviscida TaxID=2480587 RepID=A0A8H5AW74_9AGAR|nr:hypothetical protein D9619_002308 [Psilocybe cf. subviscida]
MDKRAPSSASAHNREDTSPETIGASSKTSSPASAAISSRRKQASTAKLLAITALGLWLIAWYRYGELSVIFTSSSSISVSSRLTSFSSSLSLLSTLLLRPASASTASGGFLDLPLTYALCTHPGDGKKIYTVDADNSVAECVGISGERVVAAGDLDAVRTGLLAHIGLGHVGDQRLIAVRHIPQGAIVLPGLSDSHCHILEYGASQQIPMSEAKSVQETIQILRAYIQSDNELLTNKDKIIEGWGWDHASWGIPEMPSWKDLDSDPITSGRRFILQSRDGHAIWVSKRTLEDNALSIPDGEVDGGVIFRDAEGRPTGVFMDSAQDLIARPVPTDADLARRFATTVDHALRSGLTSLHDAGFKPESYGFFERTAKKDVLPLRIYGMTYFDEHGTYWGNSDVPYTANLAKEGDGERLSRRSVKIFADGALRTGGAALYEPYTDNPSSRGAMRISAEELHEIIPRFLKDGWQVNVHAIGDRANGIVLDAFESALQTAGVNVTALRPRLEHAQIMTREDMKRLGELGVIASIQPTHPISDMWFAEDRLGPERVKGLYAFRHILDSGARITLGSDFPVEEVNPLKGFYAAITRAGTDGTSPHGPGGWFPDQRLTRLEALRGMTIDPAYASFSEDYLGSLEPGKRADWVVLSGDIMDEHMDPLEIVMSVKVLATALDGRVMYAEA